MSTVLIVLVLMLLLGGNASYARSHLQWRSSRLA